MQQVEDTLDALHRYAATASFDEYFALYADNATFIGTDPNETWSLQSFKRYTQPLFSRGKGWTYTPTLRHVYFSPSGDVAWFDEQLYNENLGVTRGSGVLVQIEGEWKITQYHLTIPLPNDITDSVVKQIQEYQQAQR